MRGVSTKLHIATDAPGDPVGFVLTSGQAVDVTRAEAPLAAHPADAAIMVKACDGDDVIEAAQRQGGVAIIAPRRDRKVQREYTKHLDKGLVQVEWFFSLLKQCRRVATGFEEKGSDFLELVHLAPSLIRRR